MCQHREKRRLGRTSAFAFGCGCQTPQIINISGNYFAVAYSGPGTDGWSSTIEILDNGQIVVPVIESLEFDSDTAVSPSMTLVSGSTYAVTYTGPNGDGWLKTIGIAP